MHADDNPFPPEALAANHSGRLTDAQLQRLRATGATSRASGLWLAVIVLAVGVLLLAVAGHTSSTGTFLLIGIGFVVVAVLIGNSPLTARIAPKRDLGDVRVESVEGAILRHADRWDSEGTQSTTFYSLEVAGKKFDVDASTYDAAPVAGYVRLYFLPRRNQVVNLERLPDKPMPPGTSPAGLTRDAIKGFFIGDSTQRAEANAALFGLVHSLEGEFRPAGTWAPPQNPDPRPLNEAILGTWSNSLARLSFMPDGTVAGIQPGGKHVAGHWSVDTDGKLHSDILGRETESDAWVADDQLTIAVKGTALVYKRESA